MTRTKPRKINWLLNRFGPLASASGRERLNRLQRLESSLPAVAQALGITSLGIHSAGFRTLTLSVPDGATATRLRYRNQQLVQALRQATGLEIARVSVRVDPASARKIIDPESVKAESAPDPAISRHLKEAASGIQDPPLREALLKLARHVPDKKR